METNDKPRKKAAAPAAARPINVFRIDDVSVSIFARAAKSGQGMTTHYTVSFSRAYKDPSGDWKYGKTFAVQDLEKVTQLCGQAETYIRSLPQ